MSTHLVSPKFLLEVQSLVNGAVPSSDNSSIDTGLVAWNKLKTILDESTTGSAVFTNAVVSTYSLVYTTSSAYIGGILSSNGDINLIPHSANRGQKISNLGIVSTYSLVYSTVATAYAGGVLSPNGDINFIPFSAAVGQKLNSSGVVSTYSLVYTTSAAYVGGVLGTNGDTHFIPCSANRGQKISSAGVVSTYSLVYTTSNAYYGGVLAPNGDINFIPFNATVGQKISSAGVVSTYSLVYTVAAGGGGFSPVAYILTSGTSFTIPAGATTMKAWAVGPGGIDGTTGGGYGSLAGAGGVAYKTWTGVSGGASVTYAIGTGINTTTSSTSATNTTSVTFSSTIIKGYSGWLGNTPGFGGGSFTGGDGGANGGNAQDGDWTGEAYGALGGADGATTTFQRTPMIDISGLKAAVTLAGGKATEDQGTTAAFGSGGAIKKGTPTKITSGYGGGNGLGAVVLYFT